MDDRKAMSAIFYVLRTGCQWNALPRSLGASSTVHDRFQEWRKAGVFKQMWIDGLAMYDKKTGIDWKWQAMDGALSHEREQKIKKKTTGSLCPRLYFLVAVEFGVFPVDAVVVVKLFVSPLVLFWLALPPLPALVGPFVGFDGSELRCLLFRELGIP